MNDFDTVYRANAARVLALSRRFLGGGPDAEDMVQETFLSLWRRAATYDSVRGSEATWIKMIARNRAIDEMRRNGRRRLALERLQSEPSGAWTESHSELSEGCLDRASIDGAISSLPAKQQEVLRLAYFEERSHREIAMMTSTPLGTVKTRLRMALEKLSRALAEVPANPPDAEDK